MTIKSRLTRVERGIDDIKIKLGMTPDHFRGFDRSIHLPTAEYIRNRATIERRDRTIDDCTEKIADLHRQVGELSKDALVEANRNLYDQKLELMTRNGEVLMEKELLERRFDERGKNIENLTLRVRYLEEKCRLVNPSGSTSIYEEEIKHLRELVDIKNTEVDQWAAKSLDQDREIERIKNLKQTNFKRVVKERDEAIAEVERRVDGIEAFSAHRREGDHLVAELNQRLHDKGTEIKRLTESREMGNQHRIEQDMTIVDMRQEIDHLKQKLHSAKEALR